MQNLSSRLTYFNAKYTLSFDNFSLTLFLDIDSSEKILGAMFDSEGDVPEILVQELNVAMASDFKNISTMNSIIYELYTKTLDSFTGRLTQNIMNAKKYQSDTLICRCLGINEGKILELSLKYLGDRKKVVKECGISQVCGDCKTTFVDFLQSNQWAQYFYQGKSQADWIIESQRFLDQIYIPSNKTFNQLEKEVISFSQGLLKIKITGDRQAYKRAELHDLIYPYIQNQFGNDIKISLVL